jgi:hypothetical protein
MSTGNFAYKVTESAPFHYQYPKFYGSTREEVDEGRIQMCLSIDQIPRVILKKYMDKRYDLLIIKVDLDKFESKDVEIVEYKDEDYAHIVNKKPIFPDSIIWVRKLDKRRDGFYVGGDRIKPPVYSDYD